jgi:predicted PurR-regulated permease PerM
MTELPRGDLTRIVLAVLFIGGLLAASLWILRPFLGALIWAIMIVVPTWHAMLALQRFLGGRRWLAVTVMSFILLLVLIVPLSLAIGTIVANADDIIGWAKQLRQIKLPAPPSWLGRLPVVGDNAVKMWRDVSTHGFEPLAEKIAPYAGQVTRWFVGQIGTLGAVFLQFLLTVIAAAVLYASGERAADAALRFGARLAGEHGEAAVRLSGQAIRGVAMGIVVTALVQSLIAATGLLIAGVPFVAVLTAFMFLLCVAQIGVLPVMVPAVIWLYWGGSPGWGTFLLVVTVIAATVDNVLRPFLIKKGADLPLLLIFIGVIGGIVGFGLIGIFVGPVLLAVSYTLLDAWLGMGISAKLAAQAASPGGDAPKKAKSA